jgi:hypothetical protein
VARHVVACRRDSGCRWVGDGGAACRSGWLGLWRVVRLARLASADGPGWEVGRGGQRDRWARVVGRGRDGVTGVGWSVWPGMGCGGQSGRRGWAWGVGNGWARLVGVWAEWATDQEVGTGALCEGSSGGAWRG